MSTRLQIGAGVVTDDGRRYRVRSIKAFNKYDLLKYDPAQPRDEIGRWTNGGGGSAALSEDSGPKPPAVGREFIAFRLGSEAGDVSNRNVGNARALADHLVRISDFDAPSFSGEVGDTITVWGITLTAEPSNYKPVVGGAKVAQVGRRVRPAGEGESAVSYSLPENGNGYRGRPIARIPLRVLVDAMRAEGYGSADDAGTNATTRLIRRVTSVLKYVEKAYDPNQPRDERGRWTSGGGSPADAAPDAWSSMGVDPDSVPGAEHAAGLPEYLSLVANRVHGGKPSVDGFVLAHGRGFPTDAKSFVGGEPKQCYKNSLLAVMADDSLTYVEGYMSVHGVPVRHAWTVTEDGVVRDQTLREDSRKIVQGYFGVPIKREYALAASLKRGKYGILVHEQHEQVMRAGPGKIVAKAFDPNQPRDDIGRWTYAGVSTSGVDPSTLPQGSERRSYYELVQRTAIEVAEDMDYDSSMVKLVEGVKTFSLAGNLYRMGGSADIHGSRTVTLYPDALMAEGTDKMGLEGMMAHEIMHVKYQAVLDARNAEVAEMAKVPNRAGPGGVDQLMRADGSLKPPFEQQFPVYHALHTVQEGKGRGDKVYSDNDGVSSYSLDWWREWKNGTRPFYIAVHETLAEMARAKYTTGKFPDHMGPRVLSYRGENTPPTSARNLLRGAEAWRDLYRMVNKMWPVARSKVLPKKQQVAA